MSTDLTDQPSFYIGPWLVLPRQNRLKRENTCTDIEPKLMQVLCFLSDNANQVVSSDELILHCWPNQYISDNPVHKCIALLRKALTDDAKNPRYIKTIPKRGYALIAAVKKNKKNQQHLKVTEPFWLSEPPYMGLKPYTSEQQRIFFGRDQALSEIKKLVNQLADKPFPFLLLSGPTGVGKTSLIQAALIPYLLNPAYPFARQFSHELIFNVQSDCSDSPVTQLMQLINNQPTPTIAVNADYPESKEQPKQQTFDQSVRQILFIDQLERLFSNESYSDEEIQRFFTLVLDLIHSKKLMIIASVRNEYYAQLIDQAQFREIKQHALHYDLAEPNSFELKEIIALPAAAAGIQFEFNQHKLKRLDECIIEDCVSLEAPLPLISYTMEQLFLAEKKEHALSFHTYDEIKGIAGVMSQRAEQTYNSLSTQAKSQFQVLLYQLILIKNQPIHTVICQSAPLEKLTSPEYKEIIHAFSKARLFVIENKDNNAFVRIGYEGLLSKWQRLRDWVQNNKKELNDIQLLKAKTAKWLEHEYSRDYLSNDPEIIHNLNKLYHHSTIQLDNNEQQFVIKSLKKHKNKKTFKVFGLALLMVILTASLWQGIKLQQNNKTLRLNNARAEALISSILIDTQEHLSTQDTEKLLNSMAQELTEYYQQHPHKRTSAASLAQQIQVMNVLGKAAIKHKHYSLAYNYLDNAIKLNMTGSTASAEELPERLFQISQSQFWLGYLAYLQNKEKEAQTHWQVYLKHTQQLISLPVTAN